MIIHVAPPQDLRLLALDEDGEAQQEYVDGEIVTFTEKETYYFRCRSIASFPAPSLRITLHKEDVTKHFTTRHTCYVTSGASDHAFERRLCDAEAVSNGSFHFDYNRDVAQFRCSAFVPGQEVVSISVKPRYLCK